MLSRTVLVMQVVTPALTTGAAVLALHRVLLELQQHMRQHPSEGAPSYIAFTMGEASLCLPLHARACTSSIPDNSPCFQTIVGSLRHGPSRVWALCCSTHYSAPGEHAAYRFW